MFSEWLKRKFGKKEIIGANPEDDLKSLENAKRFLRSKPVLKTGALHALKTIHFSLFQGIYEFAGHLRTANISKGGFHFLDVENFPEAFAKIREIPENSFDRIMDKYLEMNIVHPFREGNGRSMRVWLDDMFVKRLNLRVDWRLVDKNDYLEAMIQSPFDRNPIKSLLSEHMTENIDDPIVIFHGLEQSYLYEIDDEKDEAKITITDRKYRNQIKP